MQVLEFAATPRYCVKTLRNYNCVTNIMCVSVCKIRSIVRSYRNCLPYAKQRNSFLPCGSNQGETRIKNQIAKAFITNAEDLSQPVPVLKRDLIAVLLLIG